ncbi:DNA polymerase I [Candidatus Izimaplasma bacterium ZiA1]|uniref:DNA polymerase I n=1 Tax=Candidatus Izimoplasma sp. ZiA1 TaxID=2024899 RepID=UPI000BAA4D47|nr:DNA polymerase I [Candidatus Izimaplasma bacterium ZiA1]
MKRLILIDGSNIMFRAYYATAYTGNLMENSKGVYTNAVFGFVNMMNSIVNDDFTHIMVAFDKGKATFRHEMFEDYKGGRKPMPDEFRMQIPLIKESLEHLGIKMLETELIEADDIIGTFTKKYYNDFDEIEIISNDKDLLQLVNDKVYLKVSRKGLKDFTIYNKTTLKEAMGVYPSQITDLKGLMGDASDNLPGIKGVGEKTAVKLLDQYENLENVIADKDNIKGKLGERIRNDFEQALLCKKIATIKVDCEVEEPIDYFAYSGPNNESLIEFYQEMEFHSLIKRINKTVVRKPNLDFNFKLITDSFELDKILVDDSFIVLESFNSNYHLAIPLGFAITNKLGSFFVPYNLIHQSLSLQMFLSDELMNKSVYNLKMMKVILLNDGYDICGVNFDLLLAAYILNPSNTKDDFRVVVSNFDYNDVSYYEEIYGKGAKYQIPLDDMYQKYAVKKTIAIKELKEQLLTELKENNQYLLFHEIELPVASVLAKMEVAGINVNQDYLEELNIELTGRIENLTKDIHELANKEFNISSPKQLGEVLFEDLGLKASKKTKTGYSTGSEVLEKLLDHHPIIEKIMMYRMLTKLHSTYIIGLKNSILKDNKIHTIYRQAFTSTGRLSSIEPNLQNIPIRYEEGRLIRKVFIPSSHNFLLASDYSQIELRVLAHMANEDNLIQAFRNGEDIHTKTASLIFDKEEISSLERRVAKAVNFGIIYGQSAWGLSEGINITPKQASQFIEKYYARFPGIKAYMDKVVSDATVKGYAETIYNRRRYLPELSSSAYMQREAGKRNAMNAPIQGSAADIIKIAMIDIDKALTKQKLKSKLLLQIHDELVFDVHYDEVEIIEKLVKETMENCISLKVPLVVDQHKGKNLYETK